MIHPNHNKAQFKYNGGRGALICSGCRVILKTGDQFTEEEIAAIKGHAKMDAQYCKKCQLVDLLNDIDKPYTSSIRTLGDEKYKVVTVHSPFPEPLVEFMRAEEFLLYGWANLDGDSGVDFYIPM